MKCLASVCLNTENIWLDVRDDLGKNLGALHPPLHFCLHEHRRKCWKYQSKRYWYLRKLHARMCSVSCTRKLIVSPEYRNCFQASQMYTLSEIRAPCTAFSCRFFYFVLLLRVVVVQQAGRWICASTVDVAGSIAGHSAVAQRLWTSRSHSTYIPAV